MQRNLDSLVLKSIYQTYMISVRNLIRACFDGKTHKYEPKYRVNELEIPCITYHLTSGKPWVIYQHPNFCNQKIYLKRTACNYGSYRYFYLCPKCHTSCFNLYYKDKTMSFSCFKCSKLVYLSQRLTKSDYFAQDVHIMLKSDLVKSQTRKTIHNGEYTKRWKTYMKALNKGSDIMCEIRSSKIK